MSNVAVRGTAKKADIESCAVSIGQGDFLRSAKALSEPKWRYIFSDTFCATWRVPIGRIVRICECPDFA
jgi:hypothetical protein